MLWRAIGAGEGDPLCFSPATVLDATQIIQLGRTPDSRPVVIGNDVLEKDLSTNKLFRFTRQRYIFLNLIHDGLTLEEASLKSNLSIEKAQNILESSESASYLEMRELREIVAREAKDADRWWADGFMVEQGKRAMNKIQCEVWKERGKRVQPCSEANQPQMKVEIHIAPEALERSKQRRQSVEAQIVEELKHAV